MTERVGQRQRLDASRAVLLTRRRFLAGTLATIAAGGCGRVGRMLAVPEMPPEVAGRYIAPERSDPSRWPESGLTVTWIGHATFLLRLHGTTILTDPAFSPRVGLRPLGLLTLGPARLVPPPLHLEELPPLDLVLLSHAHMDHTDRPSLDRLPSKPPVVVAYDTKEFVEDLGFRELQELQWHETAQVDGVGSYNPWIRRHADPEQAWQMFREIGARYLMPMHWRTFRLSDEPIFEPIERLKVAAALQAYRIALDSIGQTWLLPG